MVNFSIIIPNYNGSRFLVTCLNSILKAASLCPKSKFEVILVDNGSTDNSISLFSNFTLTSTVIALPKNLGFAAAVNRGIKKAKYDYIVICNNDLTLDQFWFWQIIKTIKQFPKAACYCGTVQNIDAIESQGITFDYSGKCLQNKTPIPETQAVWGSSAALVVYQKKIIKKLNYFREIYFAYLEDVDLAFRLNQKGYLTYLNPKAICNHLGGGTANTFPSFRQYYTFRNWFIFIFLNYSFPEIISNFPGILLERLRNLSYLLKSL